MARGIKRVLGGALFSVSPIFNTGTVAAAGTTQATAAPLAYTVNHVTGADSTKGVRLPSSRPGTLVVVYNATAAQTLAVYPPTGGSINGGTTNAATTLAALTPGIFVATSATNWAKL
ncbi:MAG: hypothetical protein N3I86_06620 [Verrucomicrobiae bacterium]|nr:hypothetical protein [Verrucomicrobiae bacterium]MDW8309200.1 hypothetical protein [Verrucomicrobiales bacterium]